MNGVTESDYAKALAGKAWMRFYELWMGHGAAADAAQLANAVRETALGIPFVVRSDPRRLQNSSSLTYPLTYPVCAFLIAQGPYCYFGASTGWLDPDWVWHAVYEWKVGAPIAAAIRRSEYVWTREFAAANITVDTKAARCTRTLRGDYTSVSSIKTDDDLAASSSFEFECSPLDTCSSGQWCRANHDGPFGIRSLNSWCVHSPLARHTLSSTVAKALLTCSCVQRIVLTTWLQDLR